MIYIVGSTKGGVGKSLIAVVIAMILFFRKRKFKVIELDNNNNSLSYQNSEVLSKDTGISLSTEEKTKAIGSIIFNIAKDSNMDYIVDIGGGDDFKAVIESLTELDLPKTYIIPTTSDKKYLQNASDTFDLISDPENTFFALNKSYEKNPKNEFMYFFGNSKFGVKPVSENFKKGKYFNIPHSQFFQIAEDDEQTLLDLALISIEKNETEITKDFMDLCGDDESKFIELWEQYERSKEAAKLFLKIQNNSKVLFDKK